MITLPINFDTQTRSRDRVRDHAEVFTAEREVSAMLDLVKNEVERIDSRILEPACGHGNFLIAILMRKLAIVAKKYRPQQTDWEHYTIQVAASLYGIDILPDNVRQCRARLYDEIVREYSQFYPDKINLDFISSINYIIEKNIICGDALTLETFDRNQPITFSEWSSVGEGFIKRRDFKYKELVSKSEGGSLPLFAENAEEILFPKAELEYPPVHYLRLSHVESNAEYPNLPGL